MHFRDYDTRVAAYAVLVDHGRLLVTWYNGSPAMWTLPGGGVEFEETIEEAVVREVLEETGYSVEPGGILTTSVSTDESGPRPFKAVRIIYSATIVGGELGTRDGDDTTDFAEWIEVSRLAERTPRATVVDIAISELTRPRNVDG